MESYSENLSGQPPPNCPPEACTEEAEVRNDERAKTHLVNESTGLVPSLVGMTWWGGGEQHMRKRQYNSNVLKTQVVLPSEIEARVPH